MLCWLLSSASIKYRIWNQNCVKSITTLVHWISMAIVVAAYPLVNREIGGSAFFIFAVMNLIAIVFTYFFVPETKNKNIDEIQTMLQEKLLQRFEC